MKQIMSGKILSSYKIIIFFTLFNCSILLPFKLLTILTEPVCARASQQYTGHPDVTRSLIEGLKQVDIPFNYNPSQIKDIGDVVVVLAHTEALRQAIRLKKEGKIKFLLAGPNLVVLPKDHNYLITANEIDICLVPSPQTGKIYVSQAETLKDRVHAWPAGVNSNFWIPLDKRKNTKNVLIYWKNESESFCKQVETILKKFNWDPLRIKYGKYNHVRFKEILEFSRFAVFISKSESQGLAMVEAWAMDVPTLCWNPKEKLISGIVYPYSSCPYINDSVGKDWYTFSELENIICNIDFLITTFSPRAWVLKNMTDKISAELLLNIIYDTFAA